MEKKLMYLLVTILLFSCSANKEAKGQLKVPDVNIAFDTNLIQPKVHVGILFALYCDSARNFRRGEPIPSFFFNYMLDYENPWLTDHRTLSLRKTIFDSTTNIDLLNAILNSKDDRLKKIVSVEHVENKEILAAIPFRRTANYYLAKNRIAKINSASGHSKRNKK